MLLRRVIGDVLRARRQGQHRTLREVSTAANVSLGYLSEIERGQKEASSELLAAICDALGSQLSEVLRDASDTLAFAEGMSRDGLPEELVPAGVAAGAAAAGSDGAASIPAAGSSADGLPAEPEPATQPVATHPVAAHAGAAQPVADPVVSVSVRRDGPLRTTLLAVRADRPAPPRAAELAGVGG